MSLSLPVPRPDLTSTVSLPLFALVDSDPHGLDILSTYRFGSASLSHDSANLAVPRLEWLGVRGGEWDSLGIDRDELLPLSLHDRRKALAMLRREGLPDEWRCAQVPQSRLDRHADDGSAGASSNTRFTSDARRRSRFSPLLPRRRNTPSRHKVCSPARTRQQQQRPLGSSTTSRASFALLSPLARKERNTLDKED